jgi:hypothetical protein
MKKIFLPFFSFSFLVSFLFLSFLAFLIIVFQQSFLSNFGAGRFLNLGLLISFLILIFGSKTLKAFSLILAFLLGFFLDILTSLNLGSATISLLLAIFLARKIIFWFKENNFFSATFSFAISVLIFYSLLFLLDSSFSFLQKRAFLTIFPSSNFLLAIILNLAAFSFSFFIVRFLIKFLKKHFIF